MLVITVVYPVMGIPCVFLIKVDPAILGIVPIASLVTLTVEVYEEGFCRDILRIDIRVIDGAVEPLIVLVGIGGIGFICSGFPCLTASYLYHSKDVGSEVRLIIHHMSRGKGDLCQSIAEFLCGFRTVMEAI